MHNENIELERITDLAAEILEEIFTGDIWRTDENGDEVYTDEAQMVFNMLHDKVEAAMGSE